MKANVEKTVNTSFSLRKSTVDKLRRMSLELSLKHDKRISASSIVEKALNRFGVGEKPTGVKPCSKPSK